MKTALTVLLTLVVVVVLTVGVVYTGTFNVAGDDPHWGITSSMIESARERSISRQASDVSIPQDLADPKLVASGASEYAEMCTACHLAPGMGDTELRKGLYPMPPKLAEHGAHRSPAEQFWIIKHGLKMTGMPAWGLTHDDPRIWSMVAFLRKLPSLSADQYRELAESGQGGHSHEHGEAEQHDAAQSSEEAATAPEATEHQGHSHEHGKQDHVQQGDAPNASTLPAAAAEPAEVVEQFQRLLARGDTTAAANLLDPAVLIFEGGGAEKSREEYASHHLKSDAAFMRSATVRQISRTGNATGDLAWIATESTIKATSPKPLDLASTETMVLKRNAQGWRITHIHWSSKDRK
jgi:ketosteroid isomerase-like protein/mono/diheme cytochrome c family protein